MQMMLKPLHELMQETDTSWNSVYNMMARFLEQIDSFGTALAAVNCKIELLTLVECSVAQQLLIGLRPFNIMSLKLYLKTNVTVSVIMSSLSNVSVSSAEPGTSTRTSGAKNMAPATVRNC
jgi:hypothetical protein